MLHLRRLKPQPEDGYSLIEMLVVVVMVGILALIAAPSWNGLINGRRAATVRDEISQALRLTQEQAQRQRTPQTFVLTTPAIGAPTISVAGGAPQALGNRNVPLNLLAVTATPAAPLTLRYTEQGVLDGATATPTQITVVVGTARRCLIVENLLGTLRQRDGANCP